MSLAIDGLAVIEGPIPDYDSVFSGLADRIAAIPRYTQVLLPPSISGRRTGPQTRYPHPPGLHRTPWPPAVTTSATSFEHPDSEQRQGGPLSSTTELAELHQLIGCLRRCVASLASQCGDVPAMRRIVNDADRILNEVERLALQMPGELDMGAAPPISTMPARMPARRFPSRTHRTTSSSGAMSTTRASAASTGNDERWRGEENAAMSVVVRRRRLVQSGEGTARSAPTADRPANGVYAPTRARIPQPTLRC